MSDQTMYAGADPEPVDVEMAGLHRATPAELVAAVRSGVESGTIEGEVREAIDGCIHVDGVPDGEFLIVHIGSVDVEGTEIGGWLTNKEVEAAKAAIIALWPDLIVKRTEGRDPIVGEFVPIHDVVRVALLAARRVEGTEIGGQE